MRNLIILVLALSVLSGCTENSPTGKSIEEMTQILRSKKWRFDVPLIKEQFEGLKHKMTPGQQGIVENVLPRLEYATFEFTADNKIVLNLNNGTSVSDGVWVFSTDGSALVLTFSSVKAVPHVIKEFGNDKIYLEENINAGLLYPKIFVPLSEGKGLKQTSSSKKDEKEKNKKSNEE